MEVIIGVLVVTWLMSKAVSAAKLDHTYAKQGAVSPRLERKYGSREKAQAKIAKYGFTDHIRDAWRDYWPRRTDAIVAARNARAADGRRLPLRDRLAAGRQAVTDLQPTSRPVVSGRTAAAPGTTSTPAAARPGVNDVDPALIDPPGTTDLPASGVDPASADPPGTADVPAPVTTNPVTPPTTSNDQPPPDPAGEPATPEPASPAQPTGGTTTMSAPTGEAVNYETTLAEIDAQIAEMQTQIDSATAALASLAETKTNVDAMQQNYAATAVAAATKMDHEAALNLDGTTLGHAGTTVDALPVGAIDGLYDQVEAVEQLTQDRLQQSEIAMASLEAERAHIIATYGDAHTTVADNLGGDSRFLDSGGQQGGGPTPETVPSTSPDRTGKVDGAARETQTAAV